MGSPFLTFPVWQPGKIQLDKHGQELNCELAYNLVTNEVMCRFIGDSTVKLITPEVFIVNGTEFVRQLIKLPGFKYHIYYNALSDGRIRLLKSLTGQLEAYYGKGDEREIKGVYKTLTKYYIQRGEDQPEPIELTKKSLLTVFADQSPALEPKIPNRLLTTNDIINVIHNYDSLVVVTKIRQSHLSKDEFFSQVLPTKITYPAWVGKQGIYGRVYAGFDIDTLGSIRNVVILSPDNVGFGFVQEVRKALETLSAVNPSFSGRYALPIAFTYANSKEKAGAHIPINRLPDDRLDGRTLLQEVVVPYVITQPLTSSREVWGYYK